MSMSMSMSTITDDWFIQHYAQHGEKRCAKCNKGFILQLLAIEERLAAGEHQTCDVCNEPAHYEEWSGWYCLTHALEADTPFTTPV